MNLFELADYAAAAGTLLVGLAVGRRMRPQSPKPIRPICTCDHGYGAHEHGQQCSAEVKRPNRWDGFNYPCHWEYVPCPCRRYDGPDPLIFGIGAPQ